MKRLLTALFVMFALVAYAQEDEGSYVMFESLILEPELEDLAELRASMANHNKMYHAEGSHTAAVFHIVTGPNIGKLVWMMGPLTYTDLDSRPSGHDHDADWANNVLSHVESISHGEYWKRDDDLSLPLTDTNYQNYLIRYHDVTKGIGDRYNELMEKISATIKTMDIESWSVYDNEFRQGYVTGRHVAITSGFDKWAEFDEKDDPTFKAAFEAIYGADQWNAFLSEWDACISNSYDEIWSYDAELSGVSEEEAEK